MGKEVTRWILKVRKLDKVRCLDTVRRLYIRVLEHVELYRLCEIRWIEWHQKFGKVETFPYVSTSNVMLVRAPHVRAWYDVCPILRSEPDAALFVIIKNQMLFYPFQWQCRSWYHHHGHTCIAMMKKYMAELMICICDGFGVLFYLAH